MAYTYSKIASVTVGSGGSSSINFIAIPQNYTDLILKLSARDDTAGTYVNMKIDFNSNLTSSNYCRLLLYAVDTNPTSVLQCNHNWPYANGSGTTANTFSNVEFYISNYASNTQIKVASSDQVVENNSASPHLLTLMAHNTTFSDPIKSIGLTQFSGLLTQYSTATLYGIKAEV